MDKYNTVVDWLGSVFMSDVQCNGPGKSVLIIFFCALIEYTDLWKKNENTFGSYLL